MYFLEGSRIVFMRKLMDMLRNILYSIIINIQGWFKHSIFKNVMELCLCVCYLFDNV